MHLNIISKEELLKQLQKKTVSCKDVTFRIFGFSLTTFNIIISLILVFLLTKFLIIMKNSKIKLKNLLELIMLEKEVQLKFMKVNY